MQPAVRVDGRRGRRRVVQVAEHQVGAAQQDLLRRPDPHLEPGRRPPRRAGDHRGRVARTAHRGHHRLGQAVGGEHGLEAQLAPHPLDQRDRHVRRPGHREPQAGQVERAAPGVIQDHLVDRRRPRQDGDPLGRHQPHRLARVEDRLGDQGRPADQAGENPGLITKSMKERVDHQIPVPARHLSA
jgi:hypothetical protein